MNLSCSLWFDLGTPRIILLQSPALGSEQAATFLRQRADHLRVDPSRPRGASFGVVPPPPSSTGVDTVEASGAGAADADVPPLTTSNDSDIRRTLDHVLTVQAAHGQILVDVLDEIRGLRPELAQFQRSSPPPPFDDGF